MQDRPFPHRYSTSPTKVHAKSENSEEALVQLGYMGMFTHLVRKAHVEAWTRFAQSRGLAVDTGGWFKNPTVSGVYRNFSV